jgi:sec-independent protein translocase protein TatA
LRVCVRLYRGSGPRPFATSEVCSRDNSLMLAFGMNPLGLLVFLAIVLLLFGSRLPSLARSLGQSIIEFKKGMKELEDHSDEGAAPKDRQ